MDMMAIRRGIIASQKKSGDTSPIILANDKRYKSGGATEDASGKSITAVYAIPTIGSGDTQPLCYGTDESTINYKDGVYYDYWNANCTSAPVRRTQFKAGTNGVAFTIATSMIDDCYCVLKDGTVLFAGKNSPYYGQTQTAPLS